MSLFLDLMDLLMLHMFNVLQVMDFELTPEDMAVVSSFNRDQRIVVPMITKEDG